MAEALERPALCAVHTEQIDRMEEALVKVADDHEARIRRLEAAWMKVAGAAAVATVAAQVAMKLWLK
jgi:hypothetical protein